jgi:pyruvate formate lyase activating enzyme
MEVECKICKKPKKISTVLKICKDCIRNFKQKSFPYIKKAHEVRKKIGLPLFPPKSLKGIECGICGNNCKLAEGEWGYCGLSQNLKGKLIRKIGNQKIGLGSMYKDWHPTNCVPSKWCAGGAGAGFPIYAKLPSAEIGFANASIFLGTCSYHCIYCQNTDWHLMIQEKKPLLKAKELVNQILSDESFTCVCWFGGSPEPQSPFVWKVSKLVRKKAKKEGRILRICLESNGNFAWHWLKKIAKICLESGGGIKFDLKASKNSNLNLALSGVENEISYKNFERLIKWHKQRPQVPFLRASTLLVPHYIDLEEISQIVNFIASLDKTIPYSLLAFYPHYLTRDLGFTSKKFAEKCYQIAKKAGLEKVNLGNLHLLV